ncbi:hypothetical protein B0T21DRAFT_351147 [Apiosordaria backusii]|uniref:Uncharacterized protein n=1 Tax=Apiosordaria backusii TaxID=314023 RepID=A0AA40AXV4_9PEZI|nr:hypothetical protein B0T21DRAFT_351147 [Apiosordaria backusii]
MIKDYNKNIYYKEDYSFIKRLKEYIKSLKYINNLKKASFKYKLTFKEITKDIKDEMLYIYKEIKKLKTTERLYVYYRNREINLKTLEDYITLIIVDLFKYKEDLLILY